MKNRVRIVSFLLAAIMVTSLSACGKSDTSSNGSDDVEYVIEYEYQDASENSNNSDSSSPTTTSSKTQSTSSSKDTPSGKDYRGTTVRYATWKDPDLNEDGPVIDAFEKKYGIKVKVDLIDQGSYIKVLTGRIASGDSPDVYFSNGDFPAAISCLQPLDAAGIDYSDSIWDQSIINYSTVNNKKYLVGTVGNIWSETDMCFYNKKLLNDNNITTPEEYYNAGKWNWDALTKVMTDVKNLGSEYIGGYIDIETFVGSANGNFYKYSNGKFKNSMDNNLEKSLKYIATSYKNGLIRGIGEVYRDEFVNGKCGIALTNAYGLKKTGYWSKMNSDHIGFTYLPNVDGSQKATKTGIYRGWGIIKGAKNPGAAGVFLRYYLDVNNYDTGSAFINSKAETFFFKINDGVNANGSNYYLNRGVANITATNYLKLYQIALSDPNQISALLSSKKNEVDATINTVNTYVANQAK